MVARWIVSLIDTGLRLAALAAIWGVAVLVLPMMLYFGFFGMIAAAIVGMPVAFSISHIILNRPFLNFPEETVVVPPTLGTMRQGKAKRGEEDFSALLSLLDDDDAYDLRQRIKHRLMDRIDNDSDEEVESFEALLGVRERQKRG